MTTVEHDARQRLVRFAARQRIDDRELDREIDAAHRAGLTQRQISDIVGTLSQTTIQRRLRRLSADPSLLRETPAELIDRRAAGLMDDATMMERLLNWRYDFGHVRTMDGVATDAYVSGDWDDVELAFFLDLLTRKEFARLADRQTNLTGRAIHDQ